MEHPNDQQLQDVFLNRAPDDIVAHVRSCEQCQLRIQSLPTLTVKDGKDAQQAVSEKLTDDNIDE